MYWIITVEFIFLTILMMQDLILFFTVYEGDVELDYLGMADFYECKKRAYLVIGNLTVNGFLNMCGSDVGYPI